MGDGPGVTDCLGNIASILRDRNELDQAFEHYSQALDTARGIRYELGVAVELSGLAGVCFDKGELDRALGLHEEALATSRRIGYRLGVATELGNIGLILVKKEAHEQAVPYLAESLTLFQTIGATTGPTQVLTGLAQCHDSLGRERIRELLGQALPTDKLVADMLERIDQLRRRRPRQKRSQPA
jgi:tetratricopeptide (TPR) repeat protein